MNDLKARILNKLGKARVVILVMLSFFWFEHKTWANVNV